MKSIKSFLVVGGGSAGWMTAATLKHEFPDKEVTLIESPNIATVGVGESTVGGIKQWTNYLGIDDKDFMKHTNGSYKLSIKFTDFYTKGDGGFHYPFGQPFVTENKAVLNDWYYKKYFYPDTPRSDYAESHYPQMAMVNSGKLFYPNNEFDKFPFDFDRHTAYHFDATMFAIWLRDNYCIPRGVKHIKEDIKTVEQDENGVKSLNNTHTADMYIDCTGFKSLLLGETLKEEFTSYSDMLPNNSAWATRKPYTNKEKEFVPYTNCTAIENGWVWNIPQWERIGTGYVYSDKFVDDDTALKQLQNHLGTDELEFKKLKVRVGIHKRLWVKNVAAIGLAAGFIEPLESNGLYSVHEFLFRLLRNLKRDIVTQWDRDNYTFQSKRLFRNFAEFVAMHYALSNRDDTEYWRANRDKEWEPNMIDLKAMFHVGFFTYACQRDYDYHYETAGGLQAIAAGMNWGPGDFTTAKWLDMYNDKNIEIYKKEWDPFIKALDQRKQKWLDYLKNKDSYIDFHRKYIHN